MWGGGIPDGQIHFVASKDFTDIDFFQNITRNTSSYDFSNLDVYINGVLTPQTANAISAKANDDIIIKANSGKYPWFGRYNSFRNSSIHSIDYIKSVEDPLPLMCTYTGTPITSLGRVFYECSALVSIPSGLFDNNPQVADFNYSFTDCSSLINIPKGLFDKNTLVTNFGNCFEGCSSLTSIPSGLFDNNPLVTNFICCFEKCSTLTSIPSGLFDNNPRVTNFRMCFIDCSSLTSIPSGLFDKNTRGEDFAYCFGRCYSLNSIPLGLFDKNIRADDVSDCFSACRNLIVTVQIGSTSTSSSISVKDFADGTKTKGTVYCKAGSAMHTAFLESIDANVTVLTY